MKIYFYVSLFFALVVTGVNAQYESPDFSVKWNDLVWDVKQDPLMEEAFGLDDGYLVIRRHVIRGPGGYNYYMETLDKDLNRTGFHDISVFVDEDNYKVEQFFRYNDKFYLLSSKIKEEVKKMYFYIQEVDYEKGELSERRVIYGQSYEGRSLALEHVLKRSPNRERLLLYFYESVSEYNPFAGWVKMAKRKDPDVVSFALFDENLESVKTIDKQSMSISGSDYKLNTVEVSDDGNMYMVGFRIPQDKDEKQSANILTLFDEELQAQEISSEGKIFQNIKLSISRENTILCAGYYYEDLKRAGGQGIISMKVDPQTGVTSNYSSQLIGTELLKIGQSERKKKKLDKRDDKGKDNKQYEDLTLRYTMNHSDGTTSLVGENFQIEVVTSYNASTGAWTTKTYYVYKDLFVTRLDSEGQILHTTKVPRYFKSTVNYGMGFDAFLKDNNVYLMFNDHRENAIDMTEKGVRAYTRKWKRSSLSIVRVDDQANRNRSILIDYKQKRYKKYRQQNFNSDYSSVGSQEGLFITYFGRKKFGYMLVQPK
jgi:hypothetical protein